jgi:hypothetical protein
VGGSQYPSDAADEAELISRQQGRYRTTASG